jgi:hypothetical protein
MRTLVQQPKATQQGKAEKATLSAGPLLGQNREIRAILYSPQPTTENLVQRETGGEIIQRATLEGIRHPARIAVVNGALGRVPEIVQEAIAALRQVHAEDPARNPNWDWAVRSSLLIGPELTGNPDIPIVIDNFQDAADFLASEDCVITVNSSQTAWAEAQPPHGIELGPTFMRESPPPREARAFRSCPGGMRYLRTVTLIHEALHLRLGHGHLLGLPGRAPAPTLAPGRSPALDNPYAYEAFLVSLRCGEPAASAVRGQMLQP